jgi:hypothetical protein
MSGVERNVVLTDSDKRYMGTKEVVGNNDGKTKA